MASGTFPRLARTLLAPVLLGCLSSAAGALSLGGTDRLILADAHLAAFSGTSITAGANADLYVAAQVDDPVNGSKIVVYRSIDDGESWSLWGSRADADGNPTSAFYEPSIHVAEGTQDRVYLAYVARSTGGVATIVVAYSPTNLAAASWTSATAMSQAGVSFRQPSLSSDVTNAVSYTLLLAAEGDASDGDDIWFTRSTTYGASWDAEYTIGALAVGDRDYLDPQIVYGTAGVVNCVWTFRSRTAAFPDQIRYRRATGLASGGIASWPAATAITTSSTGNCFVPSVAASHSTGTVVVTYDNRDSNFVKLVASYDFGSTWPADSVQRYPGAGAIQALAIDNSNYFRLAGEFASQQIATDLARGATPLSWNLRRDLADRPYADFSIDQCDLAESPEFPTKVGVVWTSNHAGADSLWFDAEWRGGMDGFPTYAPGFPKPIASAATIAPALVNLDEDAALELVFGTADGNIQVWDPDGTPLAGWPHDVGSFATLGDIAIGDLDGDGNAEVVAGNSSGSVYAYRHDGAAMPNFPKSLGTGKNVYVSIGAVAPGGVRQIVACSGNQVHVLQANGSEAPNFPAFTTVGIDIGAPAAIGDVEGGDGTNEIVVAAGNFVRVIQNTGLVSMLRTLTGKTVSRAPSLADVDLNGDLEIAVATEQGDVYLMHHNGIDVAGGWPFTGALGSLVSSVTFADLDDDPEPELAFSSIDSTVYAFNPNKAALPGFPRHTGYGWNLYGAPIAEDIGDTHPSLLVGSRDSFGHAWRDGAVVGGWPKALAGQCQLPAASGDMDADGLTEVVFTNLTNVVRLDFGDSLDRSHALQQWPMYGYNPERNFCLACGLDVVTGVPGTPSPGRVAFAAPWPNPARGEITFEFALPQAAMVRLEVLDVAGRKVAEVTRAELPAGEHRVPWDGRIEGGAAASGIYYARLEVRGAGGEARVTRRFALVK